MPTCLPTNVTKPALMTSNTARYRRKGCQQQLTLKLGDQPYETKELICQERAFRPPTSHEEYEAR